MSNNKIKLLVLPDLFPKQEGDWTGIFVVDYLKCVAPYCDVQVFYTRLRAQQKGVSNELFENTWPLKRMALTTQPVGKLAKPFKYMQWYQQSTKVGLEYQGIDLIHAHSSVLYGTLGLQLAKQLGVPLVISEHTGPFSTVTNSAAKLARAKKAMEGANAVLAVSHHLKNEILEAGIRPNNLIVTHNPVDTELFQPGSGRQHNILFISRLDVFKGGLRTVRAFHQITTAHPQWRLTIGGDGEERGAIEAYIQQHNLADKVTMLGTLTKPEIATQFQQADFLVFPSIHESFGLVPVEAMAAGLPVIATNRTAPPEYINEHNGILIDPMDVDAIANAMQQMIGALSNYNSKIIREEVVNRFGFKAFGKQLEAIYRSVL